MKYGAQLFSLREQGADAAGIRNLLEKSREMGYQLVQVSGLGPIDPYELRDLSQEFSLPIGITHTAPKRLEEELDQVIAEHRIYGCEVIGLGSMPKSFRDGTAETFRVFFEKYDRIHKTIREAGLRFAYHNHAFEFDTLDNGRCIFDYLVEECEWDMIADVCWFHYGKQNVADTLKKLKGRLKNTHLKDIREPLEDKDFCPLGEGVVDLKSAIETLLELGCENTYVEQDNATKKSDPFDEMRRSIEYLKKNQYL